MKRLFLVLLLVPLAHAQTVLVEDFETGQTGNMVCDTFPDKEWYRIQVLNEDGTCLSSQLPHGRIVSGSPINGATSLRYFDLVGENRAFIRFLFTPQEAFTQAQFAFRMHQNTDIFAYFSDEAQGFIGAIYYDASADKICLSNVLSGINCDSPGNIILKSGVVASWTYNFFIEFDWVAKSWTVTILETQETATRAFQVVSAAKIHRFEIDPIAQPAGAVIWTLDDFSVLSNLTVPPEQLVREPAEFDKGLLDLLAQLGFIEEGSHLFFTILLVGVFLIAAGAAMQWVAPGRIKNNLLVGIQALFGLFTILLAFLDVWMFLLALMLGVFAANGSNAVWNTYYDIRDAVDGARDRTATAFNRFRGQPAPGDVDAMTDDGEAD